MAGSGLHGSISVDARGLLRTAFLLFALPVLCGFVAIVLIGAAVPAGQQPLETAAYPPQPVGAVASTLRQGGAFFAGTAFGLMAAFGLRRQMLRWLAVDVQLPARAGQASQENWKRE